MQAVNHHRRNQCRDGQRLPYRLSRYSYCICTVLCALGVVEGSEAGEVNRGRLSGVAVCRSWCNSPIQWTGCVCTLYTFCIDCQWLCNGSGTCYSCPHALPARLYAAQHGEHGGLGLQGYCHPRHQSPPHLYFMRWWCHHYSGAW